MFERETVKTSTEWSHTRYMAAASLNSNPHLKETIQPTSLMTLPTDAKKYQEEKPKISKEQFKEEVESLKKLVPFKIA
jgi:hypothetical protein